MGDKQKSELGSPLFVVMIESALAMERDTYLFVRFGWLYHYEVANGCACSGVARLNGAKEVVASGRKFFALAVGQVPHIGEL